MKRALRLLGAFGLLAGCEPASAPAPEDLAPLDGGRRELDAGRAPHDGAEQRAADDARVDTRDAASVDTRDAASVDARAASPSAPVLEDAVSHYGIAWIRETSDAGLVVRASVLIDAPIDRVWSLVRDVNAYHEWSQTLTAEAPRIEAGQPIQLHIQLLDAPLPRTDSSETIAVVDDARRAISWGGEFGDGETSTRFQLVEPADERVRWSTGLLFTPGIGGVTLPLLGANLQRAFDRVGSELKARAERP